MPDAPVQGIGAGYEVHSWLSFDTLRTGRGTPLYVDERTDLDPSGELVRVWRPRPGNPFEGRLLRAGDRYAFWTNDAGWYLIDPSVPSISVTAGANAMRRELRLFGVPASICSFERGDISIHAAAVEIFGQGVLLAGPSRYGKTTLAGAFARAGHRLLSEDSTRCTTNPRPSIYPGPAVLRLRADVAPRLQVPGARLAIAEEGRVPLIFDASARGDGDAVPLRAIIMLREASAEAWLRPVPTVEAVRDLFALTFHLPAASSRAVAFERVTDLAARVEIVGLHRPMTMDALGGVVASIEGHVRS